MRTQTTSRTLYKFDELEESAKARAIENLADINVLYEWHDSTIEDVRESAKLLGINISNVYFDGFWSQGDGAMFEGNYEYKKGASKAIMEYAPKDTELHQIAKDLQTIQKRYFYSICVTVKHSGHYYHENCTKWEISGKDFQSWNAPVASEDIKEPLKDFMRWIYRRLESEYKYLTSEESIVETIKANEYEFDEIGFAITVKD